VGPRSGFTSIDPVLLDEKAIQITPAPLAEAVLFFAMKDLGVLEPHSLSCCEPAKIALFSRVGAALWHLCLKSHVILVPEKVPNDGRLY